MEGHGAVVAFATAQAYYLDMNFMVSVRVLLVCKDVEVGLRANTGSEGLEKEWTGAMAIGTETCRHQRGHQSVICRENYCPNERMKRSAYVDSQKVVLVVQNRSSSDREWSCVNRRWAVQVK